MAKPMPWLKLYSSVCTDPDLKAMTLAQQGVYYNLLAYANMQPERGTICPPSMGHLARWVANGESETLQGALDYLVNEWGTLEAIDGGYRFKNWEKYQRKPSDEPEATRERQQQHRQKASTDNDVTPLSRVTDNDVTPNSQKSADVTRLEERVKRKELSPSSVDSNSSRAARAPTRETPSPFAELDDRERAEVTQIADILGVDPTDSRRVKRIIHTSRNRPTTDGVAVAYDYDIWQGDVAADAAAGKKSAKVQRDRVSGWANQMTSKGGWEKYQRVEPSNAATDSNVPSTQGGFVEFIPTAEQLEAAQRRFDEQARRFGAVGQA